MSGRTEGGNVEHSHRPEREAGGYAISAATRMVTIESGSRTGSPFLIWSNASMPSITWPQNEYCLFSHGASSKQMKNWELAEFGFWERAIEQVPRTWLMFENSAFRSGLSEPPMPVPVGSPACAMKPSITRWKTMPA